MKKTLNIGTVFSGIGSFEHALDRLKISHKIVFACDIDKYCKETYFANFKITEKNWFSDIKKFDAKQYRKKIDILVGGSPCQSFSMVGKRRGLEDERGLLIFDFIRIVKETQPKIFIFENVKGLLTHNKGTTWEHIKEEFNKLNYKYFYKVLNAKDFGIPQNRERVFLVAFKDKKKNFVFPKKQKLTITMQDLLEDNPNSKYYLGEKGKNFVSKEKNIKKRYTQINGELALCQKANQQFNWHGDFILEPFKKNVDKKYYLSPKTQEYVLKSGTKKFYSKPKIDLKIARPLLQSMHKMHRAGVDNYITKDTKIRKLTPRECYRLMGFSDKFKIVVSDTQAYKQAGNSIVVNIFMNIIKSLKL